MRQNHPKYSIVIPVYRESQGIALLLAAIQLQLDQIDGQAEIILIDDGSPDDTWAVLSDCADKYPVLKAVRLSRNFGKEYALAAGLELAQGDAVIIMDGDLQHPPELIPAMIERWQTDSSIEIVEAVKVTRGRERPLNRIGAQAFYGLLRRMSGFDLRNASDYKLLDRKVINAWRRMDEHNLFFRGMTAWLGFKRVQIPFSVPNRISGEPRWSIGNLIKLALTGITAFSSLPLHFVTVSGCLFFIFSIVLSAQSLYLKLTGQAVDGFATVIILLLATGSLLMISLGIIGIYLARIYDEVKRRPRYLITDSFNLVEPIIVTSPPLATGINRVGGHHEA
jgi:polyisoprenyl-phosphate glycosyltransferase